MTSMVVGVDTHKETHSAALLNELGVVQGGWRLRPRRLATDSCSAGRARGARSKAYITRRTS